MPTIEYVCPNGHRHERLHVPSDDYGARTCPECEKLAERILSVPLRPIVKGGTPIHHHAAGRGK